MATISASVGAGGKNRPNDVRVVQGGLNRFAVARANKLRLATDGAVNDAVIGAIKQFQQVGLGLEHPDGRVDPSGRTLTLLANSLKTRNTQKRITVSLKEQFLEAYDGERRVYRFPCITGDSDHPTLPGIFKIFRKHERYRSRKYNADMDFAMFFDHDGKAIHKYHGLFQATRLLKGVSDLIGSHGCVRLEESDVRKLFDWAGYGTQVQIY
ncbi:MAG: hypothetical protein RLZZ450_1502 [Pseudomonadota bacterium]|jgi:lipoprotein-anchoring transpeptidase ErfK/SrfK